MGKATASTGRLHSFGGGSIYPKAKCRACGADLWIERSPRTGGAEWYVTKDGRRHYKTRCNLTPHRASAQGTR